MAFETEPLRMKPYRWIESNGDDETAHAGGRSGIAIAGRSARLNADAGASRFIPLPAESELKPALQAATKFIGTDVSLQQLVMEFRLHGPAVRLKTIRRMIEFLDEHDLIGNPSARAWLRLIRQGTPEKPDSLLARAHRFLFGRRAAAVAPMPSPTAAAQSSSGAATAATTPTSSFTSSSASSTHGAGAQARLPTSSASEPDWADLPVIRQLESGLRAQVLASAYRRSFRRNEHLCRRGGRDRELMVLLSGSAAVVRRVADDGDHEGKGERKTKQVVAVLERNAVFGEISYFLGEPRTADVIALEAGEVLCLPPHSENVGRGGELDLNRFKGIQTRIWFLQALQRNSLFQELPSEALDALLVTGNVIHLEPGQILVREGEPADSCYFIIQGKVSVSQTGVEINRLTSGSVIGEIALLFGTGGRTATVAAETAVIAVKFTWQEFWQVLSTHMFLGLALEGLAERRLARDGARVSEAN